MFKPLKQSELVSETNMYSYPIDYDLYNPEEINLAENNYSAIDAPIEAWHNYGELRSYTNIPNDTLPLSNELARTLKHGYFASVSYIDAQVGMIINELKALDLYDNTIIGEFYSTIIISSI